MRRRGTVRGRLLAVGLAVGVALGCAGCTSVKTASEQWSDPSVTSRNSRVLTVLAEGVSTGNGACTPRVHLAVTETGSRVTVRAVTTRRVGGTVTCAAMLIGPQPFSTTLRRPVGDREVFDARTGQAVTLLDGSTLPAITDLPASCQQRSIARTRSGVLTRICEARSGGGYPTVSLTVGPTGTGTRYPAARTVHVDGHLVQVWSGGDTSETFAATWVPRPGEQAQIVVDGRTGSRTAARLLELVAHTRRL